MDIRYEVATPALGNNSSVIVGSGGGSRRPGKDNCVSRMGAAAVEDSFLFNDQS